MKGDKYPLDINCSALHNVKNYNDNVTNGTSKRKQDARDGGSPAERPPHPCSFEPTQEQLGKPNRTPRYGNESWV